MIDGLTLIRNDVVNNVAVDGSRGWFTTLDVTHEVKQLLCVVAFRETFTVHDPTAFEFGVGVEETVSCNQVNLWMVGPTLQQVLQNSGERAFADGNRAGHTDHIGNFRRDSAKKCGRHLVQVLSSAHIKVDQTS